MGRYLQVALALKKGPLQSRVTLHVLAVQTVNSKVFFFLYIIRIICQIVALLFSRITDQP